MSAGFWDWLAASLMFVGLATLGLLSVYLMISLVTGIARTPEDPMGEYGARTARTRAAHHERTTRVIAA